MPIVDPSVQASGSLPSGPVSGMMSQAVGVLGQNFPTAVDRAKMQLEQQQAAEIAQRMGAGNELGQVFQSAIAQAHTPVPNDPNDPTAGTRDPTDQEVMDRFLPAATAAAAHAGQLPQLGSLARLISGNLATSTNAGMTRQAAAAGSDTALQLQTGMTPETVALQRREQLLEKANPGVSPKDLWNQVLGVNEAVPIPAGGTIATVNKVTGQPTHTSTTGYQTPPGSPNAPVAGSTGTDYLSQLQNAQKNGQTTTAMPNVVPGMTQGVPATSLPLTTPEDFSQYDSVAGGANTFTRAGGMLTAAGGNSSPAAISAGNAAISLNKALADMSIINKTIGGGMGDNSSKFLKIGHPSGELDVTNPSSFMDNITEDPKAAANALSLDTNDLMTKRQNMAVQATNQNIAAGDKSAAIKTIGLMDGFLAQHLPADKLDIMKDLAKQSGVPMQIGPGVGVNAVTSNIGNGFTPAVSNATIGAAQTGGTPMSPAQVQAAVRSNKMTSAQGRQYLLQQYPEQFHAKGG